MAEGRQVEVVKFLADVHVPQAIIAQARAKTNGQIDLIRWGERGEDQSADDGDIWAVVQTEWRIILTGDRGFLNRARQARRHPGVVYIQPQAQGEGSIGPVVELLVFLHEAVKGGAASPVDDIDNHIWRITRQVGLIGGKEWPF